MVLAESLTSGKLPYHEEPPSGGPTPVAIGHGAWLWWLFTEAIWR